MRKKILIVLVIIVVIQFISPEKNLSADERFAISTVMEVPTQVQELLKVSCNDCHSNSTIYPWYSDIAPVSWFLARHVNQGKEHLNFSEWVQYNTHQRDHIKNDLEEVLKDHEMPLKSYVWLHPEAAMTPEQVDLLLEWVATIETE
ncbi:MAG: heme-binding domain-containing protein [Lutibacter sp.]|nr:heme-binding domain-containing protein [Lutibacter sp.]